MQKTLLSTATLTCLLLLSAPLGASAEETADSSAKPSSPGVVTKVANAVKRGASAAANGIEHGVKAAASGVERGAKAAGRGIEHGAQATARGVEHGAKATENAAHRVAKKIGGAPASPASEPAADK